MNQYVYTINNRVLFIDPSGNYFWGPGQTLLNSSYHQLQSQNVSVRVQEMAMFMRGVENTQAEYPVRPSGIKIDLLDNITGEVWEIKPWADQSLAILELEPRLIALENAKMIGLLTGMTPVAMPYNWNEYPPFWIEGFSFPAEVFLGYDDSGRFELYAGQTTPGVIAWWKYPRKDPIVVPYPIYLPDSMKYSKKWMATNG